ncbi:MAG: 50S ribosomal protein L10 [Chitinophagaceae bacterium]
MKIEQKKQAVEILKEKFSQYSNFYVTNTESLTVEQINKFRSLCFSKKVEMKVAKNTLIKKALQSLDDAKYQELYMSLKGVTALIFSENPKEPAVIITDFRKSSKGELPLLKAAFIDKDIFLGDNQLATLAALKSKQELIGEIIGILQSPAKNVLGGLQSGSDKLAGILSALAKRNS